MTRESSPAFRFYVKEWRSSRPVMRMSFAERGMYLEMLLEQWENLSLPDDPTAVAEIIGGKPSWWKKAWPTLRKNFVFADDGRIVNARLETERRKQREWKDQQSDKGRIGAAARWQKDQGNQEKAMAQASPGIAQPMPKQCVGIPQALPDACVGIPQAMPKNASSSPFAIASSFAEEIAPAPEIRDGTHLKHFQCGPRGTHCIHKSQHKEFVDLLTPRHGSAEKAGRHLRTWYAAIWSSLKPEEAHRDIFAFWRERFDEKQGTKRKGPVEPVFVTPGVEATLKLMRSYGES